MHPAHLHALAISIPIIRAAWIKGVSGYKRTKCAKMVREDGMLHYFGKFSFVVANVEKAESAESSYIIYIQRFQFRNR